MKYYILKDENAVYYECGFSCDNEIFLKLENDSFFITDSRYTQEAKEKIKTTEVIDGKRDLIKTTREILKKNNIKKIYYNPKEWSVYEFEKLSTNSKVLFKASVNFSQKKRIIKTAQEIDMLKQAVKIGTDGFERFAKYLNKNGIDKEELFLHFQAENELKNFGLYDLSFSPIIAINENASKPHSLPTTKKLQQKNLLLMDAGVKYKRYCSDRTRTSIFDENLNFEKKQNFKNTKKQKVYDIVLKAQEEAIKHIKPGIKSCEIDKIAREVIDSNGFGDYFIHSTGHGVGLDIHELPIISAKSEIVLEENMVFTVEPGIYIPNEFGVRIEDMVRVTSNGVEVL